MDGRIRGWIGPLGGIGSCAWACAFVLAAGLPAHAVSAEPQQPGVAERAGKAIDETAAKAGKVLRETGEKVGKGAEKLGKKVGEAVGSATEQTGQALQRAGRKIEESARSHDDGAAAKEGAAKSDAQNWKK
jgi:hypothetical protein